jgi:ADP-heptose:LPS heptosyltransferase
VLCAALAKIPFVLKDAYNGSDLAMRKQVTSMPENNYPGHLIERKLALVNLMGCSTKNIQMQILIPSKISQLRQIKWSLVFQLGASGKLRQWPVEYFRELANYCSPRVINSK